MGPRQITPTLRVFELQAFDQDPSFAAGLISVVAKTKPLGSQPHGTFCDPRMQWLITCSFATSSKQPILSTAPRAFCLALVFFPCLSIFYLLYLYWKFSEQGMCFKSVLSNLGWIMQYWGKSSTERRDMSTNFVHSVQGWQRALNCCACERGESRQYI